MEVKRYPLIIDGRERFKKEYAEIKDPYTGETVAEFSLADKGDIEEAIHAVKRAFRDWKLSSAERRKILTKISSTVEERKDEFAKWVVLEAGKPLSLAKIEIERCTQLFQMAAGEVLHYGGEVIPVDITPSTSNYHCFFKYLPAGPVLAITPFNFPFNLLAHKIAPAIAIGAPFLAKPSPQTPVCAYHLIKIAIESGLPTGMGNLIYCSNELAEMMVKSEGFAILSFTGGASTGWRLKEIAGKKKVILELGGNAPAIIHRDADIKWAAQRIALGGFMYAGQICISVQRVYVHQDIYEEFKKELLSATSALKVGNPMDPEVVVGPVISTEACDRIELWVENAVSSGAKCLTRKKRMGNLLYPVVLETPPENYPVVNEEIFGPVINLFPYRSFEEALMKANDTRYGLQAGIFTRDIKLAMEAFEMLEYGGVIINDYPTFRADNYPYGGIKASGTGREGVRFAMQEMSTIKTCVMRI